MTDTDDLVAFLRAQLDADEQAAREVGQYDAEAAPDWEIDYQWARTARHRTAGGARNSLTPGAPSPARMLAEVAAKRRILDTYDDVNSKATGGYDIYDYLKDTLDEVIGFLAAVYADRPGYRPEWRPAAP